MPRKSNVEKTNADSMSEELGKTHTTGEQRAAEGPAPKGKEHKKMTDREMHETAKGHATAEQLAKGSTDGSTPKAKEGKKAKEKELDELAIEDLTMPRTMVQRLAKGVLPANTQIQKDAITALSKGATVFINYISSTAQTHASASNRKTINPTDVLAAMRDTEFDFMIPRLEAELAQWNSIQTGKRNEYRKKIRESTGGRKIEGGDDAADPNEQLSREILGAASADSRSAKRVKGADGEILEGEGEDDRDVEMDEQAEDEVEDDAEEEEEEDDEEEDEAEDENGDDPLEEVEEEGLEDSPTGAGREASEDESD